MGSWASLYVRRKESGPVTVLLPSGPLALGPGLNELRIHIRRLMDDKRPVLVDLSEVTTIDSTGIGILVEAQAHALSSGGRLRICSLSPPMAFQISRLCLSKILPIFENEPAALADWT
jgi:anti-sigma B factor antagonist